jgi:hypothetical protein
VRALSVLALAAAAFGAFIGFVSYVVLCFEESGGSSMCPEGEATTTMSAQLIVALVGLVPPLVMVFFAFRGAKRPAVAALVLGLALWVGWAFLNDAAVHEWGSDMRLIP